MRTLYLDCGMGAAGDMLTAALLELLPEPESFAAELNGLGIPGVEFSAEKCQKCGISGTHMAVKVHGQEEGEAHPHTHGSLHDIRAVVQALPIPTMVKLDILSVYEEIAQAESHVHGVPVNQIHFHEVGSLDAVADVTAVCLLLHRLNPEQILASPVHVGSGQVRCAHGLLPVPAPATALLLQGVPVYSGTLRAELCTPTGAALLKHFVTRFGEMPVMTASATGYGMGTKEFDAANCLRAFWGETENTDNQVWELSCNLDDMTAEAIAFAMEVLLQAGALDVWAAPITMKKSRLGTLLTVLCRPADREEMAALLLRHTTTIGVREHACRRYTLSRTAGVTSTPYGDVRYKTSQGYGVTRTKYEYEDLARIAADHKLSLAQVQTILKDIQSE